MKIKLLTLAISLSLVLPVGLMASSGDGAQSNRFDVSNASCRGLKRGKCRARPGCAWHIAKGRKKAYCARKAGASVCAGLRRTACAARAKCRWVKKSGKRRAYCRLR